jgi:hypothetical protein
MKSANKKIITFLPNILWDTIKLLKNFISNKATLSYSEIEISCNKIYDA